MQFLQHCLLRERLAWQGRPQGFSIHFYTLKFHLKLLSYYYYYYKKSKSIMCLPLCSNHTYKEMHCVPKGLSPRPNIWTWTHCRRTGNKSQVSEAFHNIALGLELSLKKEWRQRLLLKNVIDMCVIPLLVNVSPHSNPHVCNCLYCHEESSFDASITLKSKEEVAPLAWRIDNA